MKFTHMTALIAGLTLVITSAQLNAQTSVDADFQDAVIETTTKTVRQGQATNIPSGGVVIVNTNSNDNKNDSAAEAKSDVDAEIVAQPTTVVESSLAVPGRAESLRNARKDAEINTEQRIVEKLEASRLEDERRRADALFGSRFETMEKKVEVDQKAQVTVTDTKNIEATNDSVVVVVEEKAPIIVEEKVVVKEAPVKEAPVVKEEVVVVSSVSMDAPVAQEGPKEQKLYFGLTVGSSEYAASNVETQYALGAVLGKKMDERWSIESRFMYSNYFVNTFWEAPLFRELDQFDLGFSTRYNILTGKLKPYVGVGLAYVYRNYQDRVYDDGFGWDPVYYETAEATTHSIDGSLVGGLDFEVAHNFSVGAEMSYTTNVFVKNDEPLFATQWAKPANSKALEEIERTSLMVNAKYSF